MTEQEWLECTDPTPMLESLRGKASERKLRLFAVACCRTIVHLLTLEAYRKALDLAEQYADRPPHPSRFKAANTKLWKVRDGHELSREEDGAATAVCHCFHVGVLQFAEWAAQNAADALALERHWHAKDSEPDYPLVRAAARNDVLPRQTDLLRCIIGDPFRPVSFNPVWRTTDVLALAAAAYEERFLPSGELDPTRLAILADALEEVGCANRTILDHLRGLGPHVRAGFAVDLVLGRE